MGEDAGPQLFHGLEPIDVRRSLGTASGFPERMSQSFNVSVSEGRYVFGGSCVRSLRIP